MIGIEIWEYFGGPATDKSHSGSSTSSKINMNPLDNSTENVCDGCVSSSNSKNLHDK